MRILMFIALCLVPHRLWAGTEQQDLVRALQRAAIRAAALDRGRVTALSTRLRLSSLLPQVGASLGRGVYQLTYLRDGQIPSSFTDSDRISYSVTAQLDLSRLLFSREDISLLERAQRSAQQARTLAAEVAHLYYERERLLLRPADGPTRTRIAELSATLEALTGFSELARLPQEPRCLPGPAPDAPDAP
jgi:hypothetical protein